MNDDDKQFVEAMNGYASRGCLGYDPKNIGRLCHIIRELETLNQAAAKDFNENWKDRECEGPGATHHLACKCREIDFNKILAQNQRIREALKVESVGAYSLRLTPFYISDMERTLVAGNIRGFAAHLRAALEEK